MLNGAHYAGGGAMAMASEDEDTFLCESVKAKNLLAGIVLP